MAKPLYAVVREALPAESVLVCPSATGALSKASAEGIFRRVAAVFLFDFRGEPVVAAGGVG